MGNLYLDSLKDDGNEGDVVCSSRKSHKLADHSTIYIPDDKEWTLAKGAKPGRTFILKLVETEACENWFQELFLKRSRVIGIDIPKPIVSLEEKYLKRCLELIHVNAREGAQCAVSVNLGALDMGFIPDDATSGNRTSLDVPKFAIGYPMAVGMGDLLISSADEGIRGSIMGSHSMMSILSSPLFRKLGISGHGARPGGTKFDENKRFVPSSHQGSPARFMSSPSHKPGKETLGVRNQGYTPDSVQGSPISESRSVSLLADQSSASPFSQGMLQCTWDNGLPTFAFSLDDQKKLYVANAWKAEGVNEKRLDYVYSLHLKANGPKMFDISGIESELIGKMKVSTSFSVCSDNCKVMETEFVVVGASDNYTREIHTLSRNSRRSRKLSKVVDMFKAGYSLKQRTPSVFGGSSAIPEDLSADKGLEAYWNRDQECRPELSANDFLPNLELAVIVVKEHLQDEEQQKEEVGGWGLKFLKKAKVKPTVDLADGSVASKCCQANACKSSPSVDIIVSADTHGGPRTRNGGPSSLIERWKSSGHCDCGGWDIGCPLKVLKARRRDIEAWPYSTSEGACISFDMFTEGSEQTTPTLKMVSIRDGLYFISFQTSFLSPLQCFSIAVATIHAQSVNLRPKHVHD